MSAIFRRRINLLTQWRTLWTTSAMGREVENPVLVFDRNSKLLQRERAASMPENNIFDYIKDEVAFRLTDRMGYIKRDFKIGLDMGCGKSLLGQHLSETTLEHWHMAEFSPSLLETAITPDGIAFTKKVIDEELPLPYEKESVDVVLSNLNLHWVNNLPGCLKEIMRLLKKDGAFLAAVFGGDTLYQLRSSFILAELEREGGFASHISPFTEPEDISNLLTNAGFRLLTIDTEEIVVAYPSIFELMWDLKGMGENNAAINRKLHLHRDTLMAAGAIYQEMYGHEKGIPATFQIIFMIGWKPDPKIPVSQAERGTGQVSMKDLHRLEELIQESGMEGKIKFLQEMTEAETPKDGDKDK